MYRILGGDGKEYGPVSGAQMRQWIAENRVNAATQSRAEGSPDWKPLSTFPEFAADLGIVPPGAPPFVGAATSVGAADLRSPAAQRVKGPAIALSITGGINLALAAWQLMNMLFRGTDPEELNKLLERFKDPQLQEFIRKVAEAISGPIGVANTVLQLFISAMILYGAIRMFKLRNRTLGLVACILGMIPCITPCCGIITLPFGIWALIVLNKPEVKSQFG